MLWRFSIWVEGCRIGHADVQVEEGLTPYEAMEKIREDVPAAEVRYEGEVPLKSLQESLEEFKASFGG